MPAVVDAEKIKAEAKNGVLTVTLPKKAEAKPRPISVKVT
ncbi:MAG: Hsp20 family protein [Anaeromyxobacter sp.]|nr:Hsp20 family protein [Anaeromyxobacter sp.]